MDRAAQTTSSALVPLGPAPEHEPLPVAEVVEQASQAVLGFALLLGDGLRSVARQFVGAAAVPEHPADEPGPLTAGRRVVLGVATEVQHRVLGATDTAVNAVVPTLGWVLASPLLRPVARPVQAGLARAYELGDERERAARALASRTGEQTVALAIPVVLDAVDLQPVIDRVLDQLDLPALVESVMGEIDLEPIVQKVLDQLDLPALVNDVVGEMRMSSVVMQATGGITEDLVEGVRNRSADADAFVERVVARVLRRRVEDLPPAAFASPERAAEAGSGQDGDG